MATIQDFEFVDRYDLTNTPRPDPDVMCKGPCEGMGIYPQFLAGPWLTPRALKPINDDEPTAQEAQRWHDAHTNSEHRGDGGYCDGWHFITCPDCEGTGKARDI